MKFLQTNNTLDGKPRVLEIGVDFDEIHHYNAEENRAENTELNLRNGICNLLRVLLPIKTIN